MAESPLQRQAQKLTFWTMASMVVGSMVGAGVFSLPSRFAQKTGVAGAQGRRPFSPAEAVLLVISIAGAVLGIVALAKGWISI